MTVDELRDLLRDFPEHLPVILQKDVEGSGFSPLAEASYGWYLADNAWSSKVVREEDADESTALVVVLDPVN